MVTITKKLGSISSVANTSHTIYTVPAERSTVLNINVCNTNIFEADVRIVIGGDIIEYTTKLSSGEVLERTGLIMSPGEVLEVKSNLDGVVFRAYGMEE